MKLIIMYKMTINMVISRQVALKILILTLFSSFASIPATGKSEDFGTNLNKKIYGLKKEKLTHFQFYLHDIYSGPNPTAAAIVKSPTKSISGFGFISMMDDPLTEKPEMNSKLIGRAQGLYGCASQEEAGLLMAMNLVFVEGKYNGSTLSVLGRNKVMSPVREMPVIGGSGLFRFARGYVEASTYSFNQTSGDAVVEYNVYVSHY